MKKSELRRRKNSLVLFLAFFFLFAGIGRSMAQISITAKDPTLGQIINAVKSKTTFQFFHDSEIVNKKVNSVDVKDVSLNQLLDIALKGTGITYKIDDNVCYLSVADEHMAGPEKARRIVSGKVLDVKGLPLIGVAVMVQGTQIGVSTGIDGTYSLSVPGENAELSFSYIGYTTQIVRVGRSTLINVTLEESSIAFDEVVVTALGIKRASKALSYNVQEVGGSALTTVKDANLVNSLSGKIAGMNVNTSSSGVGGASKVVMRGNKSIKNSSNVLYVIDGIPMYNMMGSGDTEFGSRGYTEAIADINPEDIESVSALTGAAAAALYGSEAANGAIVITTKKGLVDNTELTVSSGTEISNALIMPKFQNRYGTGDGAGSTILSWGPKLNSSNYMGYDPREDYLQTGVIYNNSVSLSTGTQKNQSYFSAATINSNGIIPNNQYDRYNFTFRNTSTFLKDKIRLDFGGSYIIQKDQNMINQGVYSNPLSSAYLYPRGDDFEMTKIFERWNASEAIAEQYWPQGEGTFRLQNPYWINYRNLKNNDRKRMLFNVGLSYDVTDWLNLAARARIDNSINNYTEKLWASTNSTLAGPMGSYLTNKGNDKQTYADLLVNINRNSENVSFVANIGASITDMYSDALGVGGPISEEYGIYNVFNVDNLDKLQRNTSQVGWRQQTQSVFGSVEIGYKNTYYLTLTGRNDWASPLADSPQQKTGFFYPSVGLSAIVSEMFDMPEAISYLKIRGSFASVGTPPMRGLTVQTYAFDKNVWSKVLDHYPMPELFAERTDSWEAGMTARMFNHFKFDLSLYHATTRNQTFDPQISVSSGYKTLYVQTGSVVNKGIEASLGYTNKWNNWGWSSNFTFSANRDKITKLLDNYVHPETGDVISVDRLNVGGLARARFILKTGGSMGDLYSIRDLKRDRNGDIYVNADGKVMIEDNVSDIKLGNVFPKANLAWRNDLSWKGINLGFMFSARLGGVVYSATQAALDAYGVSERSAAARDNGGVIINGDDVIDPQVWYTTIGSDSGIPQYYTYSATNVRLQEASLGYTIPKNKLGNVMEMTLSLVGRNLWIVYNKAPFDPESVAMTGNFYQGIDYFMMPASRNIGFNIRIKF